jgi:hypothetical protein
MNSSLYVAILIAALTITQVLSDGVLAQSTEFDLSLCQQNCAWLKPHGNMPGQYMNYYNCIAGCQSRFWKDFDSNSRKLEKELR